MPRFHTVANKTGGVDVPFTAQEETDRDTEEASWVAGAEQRARDELRKEVSARVAAAERDILRNELLIDPGPNGARKIVLKTWVDDIENFPDTVVDPDNPGSWPVKPA